MLIPIHPSVIRSERQTAIQKPLLRILGGGRGGGSERIIRQNLETNIFTITLLSHTYYVHKNVKIYTGRESLNVHCHFSTQGEKDTCITGCQFVTYKHIRLLSPLIGTHNASCYRLRVHLIYCSVSTRGQNGWISRLITNLHSVLSPV
jgi:hypothetical protein